MQHVDVGTTITKISDVGSNCTQIFLQQRIAREAAAVTAEERNESERARLLRFQFRLNIGEGKFVSTGNADVSQLQSPVQRDVIDNFDRVIVKFSRVQILTGLICAVIHSALRWWRHCAQRRNFGKEITLLLKLIAHAARALFEHRNIYVSFALDWEQLQLLLLTQGVVLERNLNQGSHLPA